MLSVIVRRLADLGFDPAVNFQTSSDGNIQLLVRLLVPACLLIAVMLQLHIFHHKFMDMTKTSTLYVNLYRYTSNCNAVTFNVMLYCIVLSALSTL